MRGLDEMVVALGSDHHRGSGDDQTPATYADSDPVLYLSLADAKESEGGGRQDDSFLPVLTCRNCGQHFFEQHFEDLEIVRGTNNRLRGFENGNAVLDDAGHENEQGFHKRMRQQEKSRGRVRTDPDSEDDEPEQARSRECDEPREIILADRGQTREQHSHTACNDQSSHRARRALEQECEAK